MADHTTQQSSGAITESDSTFDLQNLSKGSHWNPEAQHNNCFWVAVSYIFDTTAPKLCHLVGEAPSDDFSYDDVAKSLEKICEKFGYFVQLVKPKDSSSPQGVLVVYLRRNGIAHCVIQRGGKFLCFQHSNEGFDLTAEVEQSGVLFALAFKKVATDEQRSCTPTGGALRTYYTLGY